MLKLCQKTQNLLKKKYINKIIYDIKNNTSEFIDNFNINNDNLDDDDINIDVNKKKY